MHWAGYLVLLGHLVGFGWFVFDIGLGWVGLNILLIWLEVRFG